MSNEMLLVGATFHIGRDQEEAARAALMEAARIALEKKDMRAGDIQIMIEGTVEGEMEQLTLDQLVMCWGWSLVRDRGGTGEIVDIELLDDFSSDEETFFEVLSPFVAAGSYIDLEGKRVDGYWVTRYGFTGQLVVKLEPAFPPIPLSQPQGATDADHQEAECQPEALAAMALRFNTVLPSLWEALQQTPLVEDLWATVNEIPPTLVSSSADDIEHIVHELALHLEVSPQQALLILLETVFQRLRSLR